MEIYKSKETVLVAYVTKELTIQNALNLKALYQFINQTNNTLYILNMDKLEEEELKELNKFIDTKNLIENKHIHIPIYKVGNKKCELITGIEVNALSELEAYNKIKETKNENF